MGRQYALITGASKGIGKAMAEQCGARQINLALISLHNEGLEATAKDIAERFGILVHYLEIDLALPDSPRRLLAWCLAKGIEINILINNAGIGYQGKFEQFDACFYQQLISTNVMAPALITREFLPMLRRQPEAWILYSSSFAGFYPLPFKVVYAASKSFITQFSRALHQELKTSGIHVSVLCPAGVDSFAESSARIDQLGWVAKSGRLSPQAVACAAIKGMFRKQRRIIPGRVNIVMYYLMKFLPTNLIVLILHNALCRFYPENERSHGYQLVGNTSSKKSPDKNPF